MKKVKKYRAGLGYYPGTENMNESRVLNINRGENQPIADMLGVGFQMFQMAQAFNNGETSTPITKKDNKFAPTTDVGTPPILPDTKVGSGPIPAPTMKTIADTESERVAKQLIEANKFKTNGSQRSPRKFKKGGKFC